MQLKKADIKKDKILRKHLQLFDKTCCMHLWCNEMHKYTANPNPGKYNRSVPRGPYDVQIAHIYN